MNRDAASLVLAVRDTVGRAQRGESPYDCGSVPCSDMIQASAEFSALVSHGPFYEGIEERFTRGEDPLAFIQAYVAVIFAQGFGAGARFQEERNR